MKNQFEGKYSNASEPLFENPDLVSAHAEIVGILNAKRIKEGSFRDVYHGGVDTDIQKIKEYITRNLLNETSRDRQHRAVADLLEGLIYKGVTDGKWLGENVESFPTALFDDYMHGVDQIIDFHYPETDSHAYLGLAIDVTTGNPGTVYKKFEGIKESIDRENNTGEGALTTIKYFSRGNFRGIVRNVPKAVVGIEPCRVEQLALDWRVNHESLGESPIQRLLLMQMKLQMKTFASYAERIGKSELAIIFSQDEMRLASILRQNVQGKSELATLSEDGVFRSIHQALVMFAVPGAD